MMDLLARPLSVVAHDAGAANHIFAWLGCKHATMCLTGPAWQLWEAHLQKKNALGSDSWLTPQRKCVYSPSSRLDLAAALDGAVTVVTGTGWESSLEHDARKLARDMGIRSIAVIDHWVNYADRFIRNREQVLPDEIWVSDSYAEKIAKATFPTVQVKQQTNKYMEKLVAEVESCQTSTTSQANDRILYVLEPIRQNWGELTEPGEFLALDYFMANLHCAPVSQDAQIRLRPHPSDPPGKYYAWIARQLNPQVTLDLSTSLAEAIAWSNVVAGCQTYAMVLALACKRTVISTIPPWAPPCTLPQFDIIQLSHI